MQNYVRPFIVSLILHGLLVLTTLSLWNSNSDLIRPAPVAMKAHVVSEWGKTTTSKKKPKPKPAKKDPVVADPPEEQKQDTITKQPSEDSNVLNIKDKISVDSSKLPAVLPAVTGTPSVPDIKSLVKETLNTQETTTEETTTETEQIISQKEISEEDQVTIGSYVSLLQTLIIRHWNRPSSAKPGMETLLRVRLTPTGEIISITISRSSGDSDFDESAIQAVNDAAPFRELMQLDNNLFENSFREFNLHFNPKDLLE